MEKHGKGKIEKHGTAVKETWKTWKRKIEKHGKIFKNIERHGNRDMEKHGNRDWEMCSEYKELGASGNLWEPFRILGL